MILISNINVPLETDFSNIEKIVSDYLRINEDQIISAQLFKKSVDARKKSNVHFCISVIAEVKNENLILKKNKTTSVYIKKEYVWKKAGKTGIKPIVIGFGPSGMFAALALARGGLKPIVYERGRCVDERTADVNEFFGGGKLQSDSNIQFGEGGAGTFSDGKLNTGIKDVRCRTVLETLYSFGAQKEILTDAKPHIGTDILKKVVKNIREEIISLGGEIHFNSKLDNIYVKDNKISAISVNGQKRECESLILCIGHSARDTFEILSNNGIKFERKPFAMGVRIEHLQRDIDHAMYGEFATHPNLTAADYKIAVHLENGRGVYTFCMCPGGEVINASSENDGIVVNGMSNSRRNGKNANSALLVGISPSDFRDDDVFAGCKMQREIERRAYRVGNGAVPIETVGHLLFGKENKITKVVPTVKPETIFAELSDIYPDFIVNSLKDGIKQIDKKINGFADAAAVITAPETRSSSPVRILRNENGVCSSVGGIYPCGEGAGYAGGIMSAAVDGLRCAEWLIDALD